MSGMIGVPPAEKGVSTPAAAEALTTKHRSQLQMVVSRFLHHRMAVFGLILLGILVGFAFLGPLLWPWDHLIHREIPANQSPSLDHPFGTTRAGHDYMGAVMRGMQQSLKVGLLVATMSAGIGAIMGAIAGLYGGKVDSLIMRFVDLLFVIPLLIIAIVVASFVGATQWFHVAFVIGAFAWLNTSRVVRAQVLSLREQEFIEAARAMGASDRRIIFRHLIPNTTSVIIVDFTLTMAIAILAEAILSFLGYGIQPPDVSLGFLVEQARSSVQTRPWLFYIPGLSIVLIVLAINFIGDGLRDALDPKQTQVRR
jgi:peptide/nickel transport system permease protein